jgi:molybdate transport system substrate-binding protein
VSVPTLRRGGQPRTPLVPTVLAACLVVLVALAAACGSGNTSSSSGQPRTLNVFAASSLTDAFTQLGEQFTASHPGVQVVCNFAGSSDLVAQLQQGAPADVLATADTSNMDKVASLTGAPQDFAGNKLIIAVEPGNPQHITGLADLARKDLKVVLAAPEVPAGKYAQEALAKAGVTVAPVSLEVSVKGVVTKVSLGEADAGIVYVTDVQAAQGKIDGVAIPDDQNVLATYPIATLKDAPSAEDAQAFVDLVLSAEGQKVLAAYGFLPAP